MVSPDFQGIRRKGFASEQKTKKLLRLGGKKKKKGCGRALHGLSTPHWYVVPGKKNFGAARHCGVLIRKFRGKHKEKGKNTTQIENAKAGVKQLQVCI